jgi:allantoicase
MGDGWETRRRREPGNDWIIIKLAKKAIVKNIEIATAHFKGNFPDQASIQAVSTSSELNIKNIIKDSEKWDFILNKTKLKADNIHKFNLDLNSQKEATHIRLNIYPDGGVSRLRIFGIKSND